MENAEVEVEVERERIILVCLQWLSAAGCFVWRNTDPTCPHITGINPKGQSVSVYCKPDGEDLSGVEMAFIEGVWKKRGAIFIARGIEDLEEWKLLILGKWK